MNAMEAGPSGPLRRAEEVEERPINTEGLAAIPEGMRAVSVFLVNRREPNADNPDLAFAFQAEIEVSGEQAFVPRPNLRGARALRLRLSEQFAERPPRWRAFQLAFLLLNLPGIADPSDPHRETVNLLFFPTGDGKAEAYLGLAALAMVLRRLRNPGPDGRQEARVASSCAAHCAC